MSGFGWEPGRLLVRLYLEAPRWEFNRDRGNGGHGDWLFARFFNGGPLSGTCPPMWLNVVILALRMVMFYGGQCPAGGGVEKIEKKQKNSFVIFCKWYKTHNGSKKKKENKRGGGNSRVLLEALARRFIWFGENDIPPRLIQTRRIGGTGRG